MKRTAIGCCVAAVFGLAAGTSGAATTQTWNLTSGDVTSPYSNTWSFNNANGKSLTLKAYYADGLTNSSTSSNGLANTTRTNETQVKNAKMKTNDGSDFAGISSWGSNGLGLSNPYDTPSASGQENSVGGQHAIDNYDVNTDGSYDSSGYHAHDFLLMDFNEVMAPADFRIGWKAQANTGVDFFIAPEALTGPFDLTNRSIQDLLNTGWKRMAFNNVQDCVPDTGSACPTQFSSSSEYDANFKGRYMVAAGALGGNDDAFKFSQITMNVPGGSTPIPGTAALVLIGLAGFAWTRRAPNRQNMA